MCERRPAIHQELLSLIAQYGVPAVALLIFAGELGLPTGIPAEIALLLVGSLAVHSLAGLAVAILLVGAADLCGTTLLHLAARTGGVSLLRRVLRRHERAGEQTLNRWHGRLFGHDAVVVFVVRLLPLVRMYIAIGSGLLRIRLRDFVFGAAPAALIWAGTPVALGYFFSANIHRFQTQYATVSHVMLFASPAIGIIGALIWWVRAGRSLTARVRRVRLALGLALAGAGLVFLSDLTWVRALAVHHGQLAAPAALPSGWLAILGGVIAALVGLAVTDFWRLRHAAERLAITTHSLLGEVALTVSWLAIVGLGGLVIMQLDIDHPLLLWAMVAGTR
ncbi:MAG TPA: VTT domain-containing protein [Thermomicrobiales bacterium]|nr:VTT domain-containing protein [Thermomicrobiales bacterium]